MREKTRPREHEAGPVLGPGPGTLQRKRTQPPKGTVVLARTHAHVPRSEHGGGTQALTKTSNCRAGHACPAVGRAPRHNTTTRAPVYSTIVVPITWYVPAHVPLARSSRTEYTCTSVVRVHVHTRCTAYNTWVLDCTCPVHVYHKWYPGSVRALGRWLSAPHSRRSRCLPPPPLPPLPPPYPPPVYGQGTRCACACTF